VEAARLKKGLVQVYTGKGKGKTTAAIGQAVRAAGAGLKVYMFQFIKNGSYSELKALASIRNITVEQCGMGCFIKGRPKSKDRACAEAGLAKAVKRIMSGRYDVVILDEANIACALGLIPAAKLSGALSGKPGHVEVIITGRSCPTEILKLADLVTEMKKVRHPFDKGILARRGIEH